MLGVYDYTVILTYISLWISIGGMMLSLNGHLDLAVLCLALSGLCDMFDGKIARTKKDRTEIEKRFGIQIDSLCDIVCFGVGPAIICYCMGMNGIVGVLILMFYVLADFSLKIRIYHAVSCYMKKTRTIYDDLHYDALENDCFGTIQEVIYEEAEKKLPDSAGYRIVKDQVDIALPVRVNWGGGWTDTPPHCNEKGGVVLNAAMKLRGIYPVQITVKRLDELHVEFESKDIGVYTTVDSAAEIQDCHNPYDSFALHKAALIACGIIPVKEEADLQEILKRMGGGIYLSTQVYGVPKGSGLGTSSILSGACVKGIFEFLGQERTDAEIYDVVLGMEQIMSTGGGWQDQVGGLTEGIKLISTKPGIAQNLVVEKIEMPEEGKKELKERFALIYTGQRRLARNLLRDVVGGYIGSRPESLKALKEMKAIAVLMRFALEQGDIDEFAELLNQHWKLSCMLDAGTTNTCIDQILLVCEDLIDGKFISGAGGGGFIQVILKKDVTKEQLHERLHGVFQDSGVDVWDCELLV